MTRLTPALLLLLGFFTPARAQVKVPSDAIKEKRDKCEAALDGDFKAERPLFPAVAPGGKDLAAFWKEKCGQGKDPAEIAADLRRLPPAKGNNKEYEKNAALDAASREGAAKHIDGLSGKITASLGRGEIGELYGERAGQGGVAAAPPGGRLAPGAVSPPPPPGGPYGGLYSGLDGRSADFWRQASAEIAGNPKGKELMDKFAAQGAPLPKIVVQKISGASYDMEYIYGANQMIVGTRFLKEYGLKPADLDDPAKRARFIAAASPLLYHETDHAWADFQFPRKTPSVSATFGREVNAYADEMAFIHHKAKTDPAWAESKNAQGFMAQYDAYLEDPSAFMDSIAKSPAYKDMPSMETMRKKMEQELALEKQRPKRKYPGLEDDIKGLSAEIEHEEKTVVPAVNGELNVMRAERAIDNAETLPSPQSLDKLTMARKRLASIPPDQRANWEKKLDAAGAKAAANESATIADSVKNGTPAYADQSARALEDWAKTQGGQVPDEVAAHRDEIYRAGIKKNLADAERNALAFKKSAAAAKPQYKQSLIFTLNEARQDAARLGLDINADVMAVIKKAGL